MRRKNITDEKLTNASIINAAEMALKANPDDNYFYCTLRVIAHDSKTGDMIIKSLYNEVCLWGFKVFQ